MDGNGLESVNEQDPQSRGRGRVRRRLCFGWLLAGALLAGAGCGHGEGPIWQAVRGVPGMDWVGSKVKVGERFPGTVLRGESALVLALDRGQQAVVGLDANLYECARWSLPNPIDAAFVTASHWAIAYRPVDPNESSHTRIAWIERGRVIHKQSWPGLLALSRGAGGRSVWALHEQEGVGSTLSRLDLRGETLETFLVEPAHALYPCPEANGVWVLDRKGGVTFGLDRDSSLEVSPRLRLPAPTLAARVVGRNLWVRLEERGRGWIRLSSSEPQGQETVPAVRLERMHAPWKPAALFKRSRFPSPAQRAWMEASVIERLPNGGWLIAAPEFLWRLSPEGEPVCGQGGFNHLSRVSWFGAFERPSQ